VVREFLLRHPDAEMMPLPGLARSDAREGEDGATFSDRAPHPDGQILPSAVSDGFFYALLKRTGR